MGKLFAVIVVVIALASAVPIVTHHWFGSAISLAPPEDISTHGHAIDEQMSETMAEAGFSFLAAQFVLAFFVWKFSNRSEERGDQEFPGGAKGLVIAALLLVGTEVWPWEFSDQKAWASVYFTPPARMPCRSRCRPGNLRFTSAIPARTGSSARFIPTRSTRGTRTSLGLIRPTMWIPETTS